MSAAHRAISVTARSGQATPSPLPLWSVECDSGVVHDESPPGQGSSWELRLFVTGATARSQGAVAAAEAFVRDDLGGAATLEVIDVLANPGDAERAGVVATPMLVRVLPLPERRVVGDLSQVTDLRRAFDL